MKNRYRIAVLVALCAIVFTSVAFAELPKLIPREVLLGNPVKASPRISPDGTKLSYLAPSEEGVLNVWVRTIGEADDTQVTNDTHRGIRLHFWAEDGAHLLYLQDIGGDENWHVYSVNLEGGIVRDMTPFQGIRAQGIVTDKNFPNQILVGLNLRDRRVFDMHRIDLTTGAVVLDTKNPGDVVGWVTDSDFQIRGAFAQNPTDASRTLRVRDGKDAPWRELMTWPFGENGGPIDFTEDGKALYAETSIGSDTTRLVKIDVATGKELETVAVNPKVDVGPVILHPDTRAVQAVGFNYFKNEWTVLDKAIADDFAALAEVQRGEFYLSGRDRADTNWIITFQTDDGPVNWYAYDRESKKAKFLFNNQPALAEYTLAPMKAVEITARDGMVLVGYLTLPVGVAPENLPLVLNVHGGPWARDAWGYNPESQWFANRGYATLQVNFRGSAGLGKKYLNAGNLEWAAAMQDDLTDSVKWAIDQGIADPEKVCIYGGSYGGYATLVGVTMTPDLYACGVDIVGPSNIQTLFASIPPYWAPLKSEFLMRVGDVENDPELNRKISPLFHADKIKVPLIIAQGANDPRVNIKEADQMVAAMRENGLEVDYVVYTDEGHGFARPVNRLDFYGRVDEFLGKYLGGRVEPWQEIEGSSASVR